MGVAFEGEKALVDGVRSGEERLAAMMLLGVDGIEGRASEIGLLLASVSAMILLRSTLLRQSVPFLTQQQRRRYDSTYRPDSTVLDFHGT